MSPAALTVTHFTDPGCPWAYSASPAIAALQWRYGDQLHWDLVTIGLAEHHSVYEGRGYTPVKQVKGYLRFRRDWGMPFATAPKERVVSTGRACRAIVATRLLAPDLEVAVFRALQFTQFTTTHLFDTDAGIAAALARVPGLDGDLVLAAIEGDPRVEDTYQEDRDRTRQAAGSPTEFQGKAAQTDGPVRYTAPSLRFTTEDGRSLEAGGFQPLEAYDVCIANLDISLARRAPATSGAEAVAAFAHGLTTAEVAAVMGEHLESADLAAAETSLAAGVAEGAVVREPLGHDALWLPA